MWPDRVLNPGSLTYGPGALPTGPGWNGGNFFLCVCVFSIRLCHFFLPLYGRQFEIEGNTVSKVKP